MHPQLYDVSLFLFTNGPRQAICSLSTRGQKYFEFESLVCGKCWNLQLHSADDTAALKHSFSQLMNSLQEKHQCEAVRMWNLAKKMGSPRSWTYHVSFSWWFHFDIKSRLLSICLYLSQTLLSLFKWIFCKSGDLSLALTLSTNNPERMDSLLTTDYPHRVPPPSVVSFSSKFCAPMDGFCGSGKSNPLWRSQPRSVGGVCCDRCFPCYLDWFQDLLGFYCSFLV